MSTSGLLTFRRLLTFGRSLRSPRCSRCPFIVLGLTPMLVLTIAADAAAQRPLQRLGDRIRETIQRIPGAPIPAPARGPLPAPIPLRAPAPALLPPPRVPASGLPTDPTDPLPAGRSAYYNTPQTSRRPAIAPLPQPAVPPRYQAPASQASATSPLPPQADAAASGEATAPRARLGVRIETPPPRISPGRPVRATRGALVVGTDPGSSAEAAGLLAGDLIVAVDGRVIEDVDDLVSRLSLLEEGEQLDITYVRDERLSKTTALLTNDAILPEPIVTVGPSILGIGNSILTGEPEAAPAATNPRPRSTAEGVGRVLGNLFESGFDTAEAQGPADGAAAFSGATDYEPLALQELDPPSLESRSLDAIEPKTEAESLPPPATDNVTTGGRVFAPAEDGEQGELPQPQVAADPDTIRTLLQQIEQLRLRVKQLESGQPAAVK